MARRGAILLIALLVVFGIATLGTQTAAFRDWARGLAERQAGRLLNGELTIGGLDGNLFTGAELHDVTVRQNGRDIIRIPRATARYDLRRLFSTDLALTDVTLVRPTIVLVHNENGWPIGSLLRRRSEAPATRRTFAITSLKVEDGTVVIEDSTAGNGIDLPKRFHDLHANMTFLAAGGQIDLDFASAAFRATEPALEVRSLTGRLVNGNGVFQLDRFRIRTVHSAIDLNSRYRGTGASRRLQATIHASPLHIDEFAFYIPALAGRSFSPRFAVDLDGPFEALVMKGTFVEPTIGSVRSDVTLDLGTPARAVRGAVAFERLNLATLLNNDALASSLTATTSVELTIPASAPADGITGQMVVHSGASEFAGYRYSGIDGTVRVKGRQFAVAVDARAYGATARVNGTLGPGHPGVAYNLRGHVRNVDLRALPVQLRIPRLESRVAGTYTAVGVGTRLDGTLAFDASVIEGAQIDAGSRGRINLSDPVPQYGFDGRVADLDLRRIGRTMEIQFLDQDRFASRLAGRVMLDGSGGNLTALRLTADTTLEPSKMFNATLRSASIRAHIEDRELSASALGEFSSLNLEALTGREQLRGELAGAFDVRTTITGLGQPATLDSVSGDGTIRLEASTIGPIAIDTAVLEGQYADRGGDVRSLHVVGPQLEITASGPLALGDSGESKLDYHIVHGRLEDLVPLVGRDVAGRLRLDGTVSGNGAHLASMGTSTLAPFRVDTTFDALEVTSTFETSIADFDLDAIRVTADIESVLPTIAGRSLRSLTADVTYVDSELEFQSTIRETGRTATVMGRLVTLTDGREVRVEQLAVEAAGVTWSNRAGQPFTARYGMSGLLTVKELELTSGNQRLMAEGSVSLDPEVDGSLDVRFEEVELAGLGALLLEPRTLGGVLNGTGHVAGDSENRLVTGKLAVANGLVEGFRFESLDASVRLAGGRVGVEALLRQAPGAELTVSGELATSAEGTSGDEPLSLDIRSAGIDLALLDAVSTATEDAAGRLLVDLHVTGTAATPRIAGSLNVQDGTFTVAATGMEYSSATLDVLFEGDRLRIDTLSLLDDNGKRLDGSGTLSLEGRRVQAVDLTVRANEFTVLGNELGELSIDTTLNVYGTLLAPEIAGLVRVHAGRLEVDALVDRFTSNAYALPSDERNIETDVPAPDPTGPTLDLTVQVPGNLILRGRDIRPADSTLALGDLNVTVGGDFTIRQVPGGQPVLLGTVTAVRGTYGFQGRRFDVLRDGTIAFRGERPIDPALDLQAERVVSGIVAHVNIAGTMRSPSLVLSSRPPLEEADILSLILFNQPVNRLGTDQREALGERALSLASGFVVSPISDTLEHALDIDLFELEAVTEGGGPAITLGEQVGERLFVRFRQTFGALDTSEFQLEYQVSDFLRLQGSFAEGKGRADRTLIRRVERTGIDLVVFFSY